MRVAGVVCWQVVWLAAAASAQAPAEHLLFHASFDASHDADFAKSDPRLYTAESLKREQVRAGLHGDHVALHKSGGRYGGWLEFRSKSPQLVFYKGGDNVGYAAERFQGTVSFWMQLDPDEDLPPGYVDPLQITDKKWNDAAFFVDFTKETPRRFRLGAFSDYKFWNPEDRKWDEVPDAERPLIDVARPSFARDRWTHVAFTFRGFNADSPGEAVLYLDGRAQGELSRLQRFSWDPAEVAVMLGINYVGGLDDLAIFDQALTAEQIAAISKSQSGLRAGSSQ